MEIVFTGNNVVMQEMSIKRGRRSGVHESQRFGFTLETRKALRIAAETGRQNFDRDLAAKLGVGGTIHFAHAAFAELGSDPVMGERLIAVEHETNYCDGKSPVITIVPSWRVESRIEDPA